MIRKAGLILFVCLLLFISLLLAGNVSAELFYTGNIAIDSLSAEIDVGQNASVTVEYTLVNRGEENEDVNLRFSPENALALLDGVELPNPVSFAAGETKELSLSYSMEMGAEDYKVIIFNAVLLFDNKSNSQTISNYQVKAILPGGINRLADSNMPYETTSEDGRVAVIWTESNIYSIPLSFSWSTMDIDIAATKEATPSTISSPNEVVSIEVTIQNNDDEEVRDIDLYDDFFPTLFEAVEPLEEFNLVYPEDSDPHLYWTKKVDSLQPGESKVYTYSIKVKVLSPETTLNPLTILVNGTPVAASNDVIIHGEPEEPHELAERGFPTLYVIIAAIIIVAVIASVLVIRSGKSKKKA
jgi:hypothetical protein